MAKTAAPDIASGGVYEDGVVRAFAIMERIGISEKRRVKGIGSQQLAALKSEFGIK